MSQSAATAIEVAEQRALAMAALAEPQRDMMIALGILSGVVVDGRRRFERLTIGPLVETITVFEGTFGPGEGG